MNGTPDFINVKKQVKQNMVVMSPITTDNSNLIKNASKSVASNSSPDVNSDSSTQSTNASKIDCFKGDNLQQLSTNVLPPYIAISPPSYVKSDSSATFELHCCSDCGDTFVLKSSLNFHLERRSVLIKFNCEACKRICIFYNRCTLQSHIRSHTDKNETSDIKNAIVNPLPRVFMDGLQSEFVNTLDDELNCIDDMDITPPIELLEFSIKEDEEAIIIKDKQQVPVQLIKSTFFRCLDCNEEFTSFEARKEHMTNGDKISIKLSECNKCGMVCPSKCSLKAHQRIHLQISPYVCPECGDSPDAFRSNFMNHVMYKCFHYTRGIGYKCPVCKRVSPSNESLLKHMELHTEKYLKCDTCPRAYMTSTAFDAHINDYHEKEDVKANTIYKCALCDIVFLNHDQMLVHRSTHLKEQSCEYVFNCMQCGKPLENKVMLLEHINYSHPKISRIHCLQPKDKTISPVVTYRGKVECLLCHCSFHSPQGYTVHLAKAHININQPCSYCYMIIGNRKEMVIHGKKHLSKGNVVCLLCNNKKCHDEKNLDSHLLKHVENLQYCTFCPICSEIMKSMHEALNHMRIEHSLVKNSLETIEGSKFTAENVTCHFCRASFATDGELQEHLKMEHSFDNHKRKSGNTCEDNNNPALKKPHIEGNICAKCDYQSTEREEFKKHILTHKINKNTFQCQECGLCFVVEPALVKHLRIIHKISDTKKYIEEEGTNFLPESKKTAEIFSCDSLICSVCFTTFPSEAALKTHMRSHGMAFIQANKTQAS